MATNSTSQDPNQDPLWRPQLQQGLLELDLSVSPTQCDALLNYLALLNKWNRAFNLTAVRDPAQMVSRQLLDSLSILAVLQGPRILDVGTGAGLPGVPLAIVRPDWHFTLLDSNGKKTRFVNQVRIELGLDNLRVEQQRVESFNAPDGFDTVTSRAFASLSDMVRLTGHLLAPGGRWLAMKGPAEGAERERLPEHIRTQVVDLRVPGEVGERCAVICTPE